MHKREKDELHAKILEWVSQANYKRQLVKDFDPAKLKVDGSYQRQIIPSTVSDMRRNWCPFNAGTLHASLRADGKYYVIDGQHRKIAASKIGKKVDVNIIDLTHLTAMKARKVESWIFLNENKHRKSMSQQAIMCAEFKIGYEEATDIVNTVETNGFSVNEQRPDLEVTDEVRFSNLKCIRQLRAAYRKGTLDLLMEYLVGTRKRMSEFSQPILDFQSQAKWLTMLSSIILKKNLGIEDMARISGVNGITNEHMAEIKEYIGSRNADDKWLREDGADDVAIRYGTYFYRSEPALSADF